MKEVTNRLEEDLPMEFISADYSSSDGSDTESESSNKVRSKSNTRRKLAYRKPIPLIYLQSRIQLY